MIAVYDLAVSPPTFDFVGFLVSAEIERIRSGGDTLRVVIAPGPRDGFRDDNLPPDTETRRKMLENIVIPMCSLLPSCVGVEMGEPETADFPAGWSMDNRISHYGTHRMAQAFAEKCYPLAVSDVTQNDKLITITVRSADWWPTRNSNLAEWENLRDRMDAEGYTVRVLFDDEMPNVIDRMRLYAGARLNLFVNNGPAWVAAFMPQVKGIVFKMCAHGAPCVSPEFFEQCGFPVGSQIGRDGFHIVWADDNYEIMHQAVTEFLSNQPKLLDNDTFGNGLNNERSIMLDQARFNVGRKLPWFIGKQPHAGHAIIVGGGPSLALNIEKIRSRQQQGAVVYALNGTHDYLIKNGIVPDCHVMLDSRADNVAFVKHPRKDVKYLISAYCHPDVFDALKGFDVTLWVSDMTGIQPIIQDVKAPICLVGGGATVGMKTMYLTYLDGYRAFHFFGFDSSYNDGKNHAYPQLLNDKESKVEIMCAGRRFICAPWMAKQADEFRRQTKKLTDMGCEIYVYGYGLIPWMAQQMAKMAKAA